MTDAQVIEKEALSLPEAQRALLADRLLQSIAQTPSALRQAWAKEADERMKAYRNGEIEAIDGPKAMANLRSRFVR